jgi:hypothetical protein
MDSLFEQKLTCGNAARGGYSVTALVREKAESGKLRAEMGFPSVTALQRCMVTAGKAES